MNITPARIAPFLLAAALVAPGHHARAQNAGDRLMLVVGDYELPDGEVLVIGRSLGQLVYVNPSDGHQGALAWEGGLDFHGTRSFRDTTPRFQATFERASDGPMTAVLWRDLTSGTVVRGTRTSLYDIEDIRFRSGEVELAGSVLLPRRPLDDPGGRPGIVLVHGSNAQSRYAERGRLWILADHLARQGLAVLVYDKRGIGGSEGDPEDPGLDADALAAVRVLAARPDVEASRVGLWGISQGAWIVGEVAASAPDDVAFVVAAAGGGVNGEHQDIYRTQAQMRADGFPEEEIRQAARLQVLKWRYARTREGWDEYLAAVRQAEGRVWLDDPYIGPPTDPASEAWDFWARMLNPGTGYGDPTYWERVRCPVRVEIGELDTISPPYETVVSIDRMLQRGGNRDVDIHIVPGAGHSLYAAVTGGPSDPIDFTRFTPGYLESLDEWLRRVTGLSG
jgi:pimeloyl-ACP methyl ester carboxylesterase